MEYAKQNHIIVLGFVLAPLFLTSVPALDSLMDGITTSKQLYFYAVCAMIFFVVAGILFVRKSVFTLEFNRLDLAVVAFWLWSIIRATFTPYVNWNDDSLVTLTLLVFLYFLIKKVLASERKAGGFQATSTLVIAFMLGGLIQAAYGLLQLYGLDPFPSNNYFKLVGSFGNPDALAGYLASVMPFALGMYLLVPPEDFQHELVRKVGLVTFLACLLVLPATMIRGAWLGAAAGVLIVLFAKFDLFGKLKSMIPAKRGRVLIGFVSIALVVVIGFSLYNLKPDSANGRLLIWKITAGMISDHPLWGIGFDRYAVEYGNHQAAYFASGNGNKQEEYLADNVHHAHNEFFQFFAESGPLSLVLFTMVLYSSLRSVRGNVARTANGQEGLREGLSNSSRAGVLCFATLALFSFPLHILPTAVSFFTLLGICSSAISDGYRKTTSSSTVAGRWAGILIAIVAAVLLSSAKSQYSQYSDWGDAFRKAQMIDLIGAKRIFERLHDGFHDNGKFLFTYGGVLSMMAEDSQAVQLLESSKLRYNDPNLWITLGDSYRRMRQFTKSEQHFSHASHMIPNRLYPKYLLANLYLDVGKLSEANAMADSILSVRLKSKTSAADKIRRQMALLKESVAKQVEAGAGIAPSRIR